MSPQPPAARGGAEEVNHPLAILPDITGFEHRALNALGITTIEHLLQRCAMPRPISAGRNPTGEPAEGSPPALNKVHHLKGCDVKKPTCRPRRLVQWALAPLLAGASLVMAHPAAGEDIQLAGGDRLTAEVLQRGDDVVVVQHAVLGRLEIPAGEIVAIGADAAPVAPAAVDDDQDQSPWESHFELGLGASAGNTDAQSFHAGVKGLRETPKQRTTVDAHYYYGASDGDRSENKFTAGALQEWLLPDSRWLSFAQGRYDFDEFQSWEHRLGAHGGVGYDLVKREDFLLTLRGGAGVIREFGSQDEDLRPELLLGGNLDWQISERQNLTASTTLYPDLDETGEFRLVSSVDWALLVDEESATSLSVGLQNEYQSMVDPGIKHNDFRIVAGLRFDF